MTRRRADKKAIINKLNIILIVAVAVLLSICYVSTSNVSTTSLTHKIEPTTIATLADGSKEYFFDLKGYDYKYSGIMFYTSHQLVTGYNAGKVIYKFDRTGGVWTSTAGSGYHFIDINEKMNQLAVIVKPVYDVVANQKLEFYIGNSHFMYDEIMLDSIPRFFVSLLIVILSILILIYYSFMHEKQHLTRELLYLGYFSFFTGIWSINETDVSALLVRNKVADSIVPYLCLMLLVAPMIMFFDSYLDIKGKLLKRIMIWLSMVQFVVLTVLHFTKIAEYRETLPFMQIMLFVSAVYMVVGMVAQLVKRRFTRHIEICAVGLSLFLVAVIVDIGQYYRALGDADRIGRYVFLIFILLLSWDMIKDANEYIEKGRRAKQLEIFALTDSMTGLFNRNAFETHAKAEGKLDGIVAVVADANGLKACNDTYGHEAGDEYITIVADIFSDVYGKYGNCYRTGGDEFCCIIPANKQVNVERLRKLFLAKIYTANLKGGHDYNIGVAIGDACYDSNTDSDFRALVKRADASMYENKRKCKLS
ncbi:MAG: diguanylate cyclase [Pseudobutyrivibrio sp.]|nr:diguanylate cyclase [Pseudobutyrivibrio sp.]